MDNTNFYRTELRVLQNTAKDNEEFLNLVANLLASKEEEIDRLNSRVSDLCWEISNNRE